MRYELSDCEWSATTPTPEVRCLVAFTLVKRDKTADVVGQCHI